MTANAIQPGSIIRGPTLPEPVEVLATVPMGESLKIIGRGMQTGMTHDPVLSPEQLAQLTVAARLEPFDGDARMFRLGVEAYRLGLAYEYDPYFSLSIARVDPLPHQLEAVYGYFLRLPRIRFLLADKFHEKFSVIRGSVLRANYGQNPWQENDQVITSVSWVSLMEDARESLLRSRWDLVIVDEAHKMSTRSEEHKTYAYRLGKVPRNLVEVGDRQENRYGRLGREYGKISFDKKLLPDDPALERVTPGYPLFEAVRRDFLARTENHVQRGAVFYDLHLAPVVRDDQVQRIAVEVAIKHERERGWEVESVESENRGFDLISRRPHPEDPKTFIEVRFIEVKGRAGVGVVALSENEYRTAERLKGDFWLYAVFNCAGTPYRPKPCPAGMAVDYDGGTLPAWPSEHPASRKEQGLIHVKPDSRHR